jgi:parvulin-like peptidyl-prolyl isomerase
VIQALEGNPWSDPDKGLVEINGKVITQGEFYHRVLRQFGTAKLLAGVIAQEIVLQEAQNRGIVVSEKEVEDKVDEIIFAEQRRAGGAEALAAEYAKVGVTLSEIRRDHVREVETQLLLSKLVRSLRTVNADVLREYYKTTYANTRYQTRHIAYSFQPEPGHTEMDRDRRMREAYDKAARAADRIRRGADFATLAQAESEDRMTAERGGELPPVPNDERVPPYMREAFSLSPGEVSDPIENPMGAYHVFQVRAIIPSESFVDCERKMEREILEREPTEEEVGGALIQLRKDADVRMLEVRNDPKS